MTRLLLSLLVSAAILLGLVVPQIFFIVDEREQAIITELGQYKRTIQEPGLHAKTPVIQTVHRFDRRI